MIFTTKLSIFSKTTKFNNKNLNKTHNSLIGIT